VTGPAKSISVAVAAVALVAVGGLLGRGCGTSNRDGAAAEGVAAAARPAPQPAPETLALAPAARVHNPVHSAAAALTRLAGDIQAVGTVAFHEDHVAVVGPLVSGRISRLAAGVGDRVKRGQVLAEIESSEVGQARADLLAAKARYAAADANLRRETDLAEKKISSSREQELAHAQWVTEQAGVNAATMRLRAIGMTPADVDALASSAEKPGAARDLGGRVLVRAPIAGTIIERKVTLGQAVERATDAFKIADSSEVWVSLDLYEKDLARVQVGQPVEVSADARPGEVLRGKVAFVVPVIDEATRTAKVRVAFPNPNGQLNAGQLVTARIIGDPKRASGEVLAVPRSAVEQVEGKTVVFVERGDDGGFERRNVITGISGGDRVEIRQGLAPGERVAADGAFLLKSELLR
jgi:cobalt-zinc-cadmium efflux system membrane fusion protein